MNKKQPLPIDWSGNQKKTPWYSTDHLNRARHVDNRQISGADRDIMDEPEMD